jgi:hypothetical protein
MQTERLINTTPQIQPSVNYFDAKLQERQTLRWLGFIGDRIHLRLKQEISWLRGGGVRIVSPCLKKYGLGYIPRGYAALVEQGENVMPTEHLRAAGGIPWTGFQVEGQVVETIAPLSFTFVHPGDAVNNILSRAHNDGTFRNGTVELESLRGRSWNDCHLPDKSGLLDKMEIYAFGDGQEPTLRGISAQIQDSINRAASEDLRFANGDRVDFDKFSQNWLASEEEFYNWGMARLDEEHPYVRDGKIGSMAFRYSPLCELLLTQLEVVRQDRSQIDQWREQVHLLRGRDAQPPQFDPATLIELGAKLERAEARIRELEASGQVSAAGEAGPSITLSPKFFTCECGKEFDAAQGLQMHKSRWCELTKQAE